MSDATPKQSDDEYQATARVTAFPASGGADSDHRALPHNMEAEQALLGALLVDNSIIEAIDDGLREEHFYDPVHGRIFAAVRNLTGRGNLANPITLKSYFANDSQFAGFDVEGYLADLADGVLSLSDSPDYEREIRQCHLRRELIRAADGLISQARAADLDCPAETMIEEAEQRLFKLADNDQGQTGLIPFSDAIGTALRIADEAAKTAGGISGIGTGLRTLDQLLGGLQKSDLIILAGRPGMGKTALGTNIAFHAATTTHSGETPQQVAFFSLEMSSEQLANRILSSRAAVPSDKIRRGALTKDQFNNLVRAAGEIETAPFYIDDTPAISVSQIYSRARRLKRTKGLGLIVVDYLQLLAAPLGQKVENRVQEISSISRMLKTIAKDLNVPVLALSQLSRAVEQREDKRPVLADLRESGSIEQDADVVMFLYREEYYLSKSEPERRDTDTEDTYNTRRQRWVERAERAQGRAEIIVSKQRHGPTGLISPNFIAEQAQFIDYEAPDHLPERFE